MKNKTVFISLLVAGLLVGTGVSLMGKGKKQTFQAPKRATGPVRRLRFLNINWEKRFFEYAIEFQNWPGERDAEQVHRIFDSAQRSVRPFEAHTVISYSDTNTGMVSVDLYDDDNFSPIQRLLVNFVRREHRVINLETENESYA